MNGCEGDHFSIELSYNHLRASRCGLGQSLGMDVARRPDLYQCVQIVWPSGSNGYLVNHTEYSNSIQSMSLIPQARVAGYDAQQ